MKTPEQLAWDLWCQELGDRDSFIPAASKLFAEAMRIGLQKAIVIAEKRSEDLRTIYKMHNGLPDIRGSVGAGEVALLIKKVIDDEL